MYRAIIYFIILTSMMACSPGIPKASKGRYLHILNPFTDKPSSQVAYDSEKLCRYTRVSMLRKLGRDFEDDIHCSKKDISPDMLFEATVRIAEGNHHVWLTTTSLQECSVATESFTNNKVQIISSCAVKQGRGVDYSSVVAYFEYEISRSVELDNLEALLRYGTVSNSYNRSEAGFDKGPPVVSYFEKVIRKSLDADLINEESFREILKFHRGETNADRIRKSVNNYVALFKKNSFHTVVIDKLKAAGVLTNREEVGTALEEVAKDIINNYQYKF